MGLYPIASGEVIADLYAEGVRIATTLKDLDGPNVNPLCHTRLYSHGYRTDRSLVLLHGFTNCPQQFDALGRRFHENGWNVLIPRYPRHGYTDRLNTTISELRADHLMAVANKAAEAGAGLGVHLTVAGLSLGGILTGYVAQTQDAVERAVLIAPMFGLRPLPGWCLTVLSGAASLLPNFYMWWNRELKDQAGPSYGYPRFSTHAYAALFEVGRTVQRLARGNKPRAGSIVVITNASEPRLDNRFTYQLVQRWREHGASVETYEFPRSNQLPHDLIDPGNAAQNTEFVYPLVTKLITG
jgi:pimeloyl-ACP methyl ester carboxylesterase